MKEICFPVLHYSTQRDKIYIHIFEIKIEFTLLFLQAVHPLAEDLLNVLGFEYKPNNPIHTAAVCVYPSRVKDAYAALERMGMEKVINVASGMQ